MSKVAEFPNITVIEDQACDWIVKLEGDNPPSAKALVEFKTWLAQSPKHKAVLLSMAGTWGGMDVLSGLSVPHDHPSKRSRFKVWLTAPLSMLASMMTGSRAWIGSMLSGAARPMFALSALALLFTLGLSIRYVVNHTPVHSNVYLTALGEHSVHTLDDGSVLWLNSNTQVEVNYSERKRKIMLLKGEAHFDVVPDPLRPFEVYAGNRMVKAVGTAFSVYRLEDRIQIMVTEGKVDLAIIEDTLVLTPEVAAVTNKRRTAKGVGSPTDTEPKIKEVLTSLTAGQSVVIPTVADSLVDPVINHARGELARKLSWLEGKLVFAGESLDEVVQEVSRHTPIKIEVSDPELKTMRIGGQFQAGETDALFDVLESGFGIKITRVSKRHVQLHAK
jgi:transmembrane sensor